jgi:hypothetical protein
MVEARVGTGCVAIPTHSPVGNKLVDLAFDRQSECGPAGSSRQRADSARLPRNFGNARMKRPQANKNASLTTSTFCSTESPRRTTRSGTPSLPGSYRGFSLSETEVETTTG